MQRIKSLINEGIRQGRKRATNGGNGKEIEVGKTERKVEGMRV